MGPWNAAEMFLEEIKKFQSLQNVKEIYVEFFGSLAKTGVGHGTDIAAMLALSGEKFKEIDTNTIDDKIALIKDFNQINLGKEKKIPFVYGENLVLNMEKSLDFHPNGMIFKAIFENDEILERDYYSVGGGFVCKRFRTKSFITFKTSL
jgi:L-serine dehydratase